MATATAVRPAARQRILESAYVLFTERRVHDVGVNEIISHANVTKATFYSHFASKDDLVLAFLELREQRATLQWLDAGARERASTSEDQLLAIFDLFEEWFRGDDFTGCPFINVLLEFGSQHASGRASIHHLDTVRAMVQRLAEEAGLSEPAAFARAFHLLMKGACVAAVERDITAAQTAKAMARQLIERYR